MFAEPVHFPRIKAQPEKTSRCSSAPCRHRKDRTKLGCWKFLCVLSWVLPEEWWQIQNRSGKSGRPSDDTSRCGCPGSSWRTPNFSSSAKISPMRASSRCSTRVPAMEVMIRTFASSAFSKRGTKGQSRISRCRNTRTSLVNHSNAFGPLIRLDHAPIKRQMHCRPQRIFDF